MRSLRRLQGRWEERVLDGPASGGKAPRVGISSTVFGVRGAGAGRKSLARERPSLQAREWMERQRSERERERQGGRERESEIEGETFPVKRSKHRACRKPHPEHRPRVVQGYLTDKKTNPTRTLP